MRHLILTVFTLFSLTVAGAETKKELKDLDLCDVVLGGSSQLASVFFQNYIDNVEDGLGPRGFQGAFIPNTAENQALASKYGMNWWGVKWSFVDSLEEAIAHRAKARELHLLEGVPLTDITIATLYIIGKEEELGLEFNGNFTVPVPPEKVAELIARGSYEIDHEGRVNYISPEQLARRVSPEGMVYANVGYMPRNMGKNSISQSGWVAFKQHGIHDYSTWKNSSEAKKLRKEWKKLADRGWTIRANQDYKKHLDAIANQPRSFRDWTLGEDGQFKKGERVTHKNDTNRYQNPAVYQPMLKNLLAGKGYSVGLYDGTGRLMGGEIGGRDGNHYYGDSIHYADDQILYAKIATLALFEMLSARGMDYSDPGMVSHYSTSLGAELVPFREYMDKVKGGPSVPVELPATWEIRSDEQILAALAETARKKSQGLTHVKFTRRSPVIVDPAKAAKLAARAGLSIVDMKIVFVPDAASAARIAAQTKWEQLPIFVEGAPERARKQSSLEYLRALVANPDVKIYFIGSPKHPEIRREIPARDLAAVLDLDVTFDAPVWGKVSKLPALKLRGYGFAPAAR